MKKKKKIVTHPIKGFAIFEIGPKESEVPFATTTTSLTAFWAWLGRGEDNIHI